MASAQDLLERRRANWGAVERCVARGAPEARRAMVAAVGFRTKGMGAGAIGVCDMQDVGVGLTCFSEMTPVLAKLSLMLCSSNLIALR